MQDRREEIFRQIRGLLKRYEPPFIAKSDFGSRYELWSSKEVEIAGRKRKEVFFSAVIIQNSYVGFYYMPVYAKSDLKEVFGKELLATLKGKSCFHITKLDRKLTSQIRQALAIGYKLYEKNGWV